MFDNVFSNDSYRPESAYEIEKRVRAREEEFSLWGFQKTAEESRGSRLTLIPFKELFSNLFTSPKVSRRQYAAGTHK